MKKIFMLLLSSILCLSCSAACAAENDDGFALSLQIGNPKMTVNGTEKNIDENGTAPVIINSRTLLPVRAVVEEMGGAVTWEADTRTAALTYGDDEIRLTIDNTTAYLNGEPSTLEAAPTIINDRTMLPIRFIAESFKFDVEWDGETQTVTVTKGDDIMATAEPVQVSDNLILMEGGTFKMGSPEGEAERDADEVMHSVTVDSFYMDEKELTQSEYQSVMGSNPSENSGDNLPVENVTWYDAIEYCNKRSQVEGLTPCYTVSGDTVTWNKSANGYRLPTEAEWEYAARANTDTPFNFGSYVEDTQANCYNAYGYNNDASGSWVNGYVEHTLAVDSYDANSYGLYNMHGNVGEWVWDWYGAYSGDAVNPTGAEEGHYKVVRGGGWNDFPKHIRSAYRSAYPADAPLYSIGIRVVRNAAAGNGSVKSVNDAKPNEKAKKTLIAYFSQTGNTDGLAKIIGEISGADIFRIERATPYSATSNSLILYAEALNEQRENAIPDLKAYLEDAGLNIDDYDTILLGYCNWWASIPAPVRSFLTHYDMSGKTIIPFCSMGGGRFGQTISAVAKLCPDSAIKEGLDVTYSSYDRDEITAWLKASGIME